MHIELALHIPLQLQSLNERSLAMPWVAIHFPPLEATLFQSVELRSSQSK